MAQLDRAPDFESGGCRFESCRFHQSMNSMRGAIAAKDQDLVWYVVHTGSRQEELANNSLMMAGFETLLLRQWRVVVKSRKKLNVLRPWFPRYLFVGVAPGQSLFDVNEADGVSVVLHGSNGPYALTKAVMDDLRRMADPGGVIHSWADKERRTMNTKRRFSPGEKIRICGGPFTGMLAVVELDNGKIVDLILEQSGLKAQYPAADLLAEASP